MAASVALAHVLVDLGRGGKWLPDDLRKCLAPQIEVKSVGSVRRVPCCRGDGQPAVSTNGLGT